MKKIFWIVLFDFLLTFTSSAQTLTPLVAELGTKPGKTVRSSFQIQNNQLQPVAFVIESYSLAFSSQGYSFRPLDSGVKVEVSQTSGRLGPKEIRTLDTKITCAVVPCTVAIKVGMVTGHTADGIAVRIILSNINYVCNKAKDCRTKTLMTAGYLTAKK